MTIADCLLLGQSASGLNFNDDSGLKAKLHHFPSASGLKLLLADDVDATSLSNDDAQLW
jgi:hypothetical protein